MQNLHYQLPFTPRGAAADHFDYLDDEDETDSEGGTS